MDTLREWFEQSRGRQKELAEALGVFSSAFASWTQVPAERVRAVSEATGIPKHKLRPDLYDEPHSSSVATPSVAAVGEGEASHG